jgi:superfamily I DNA and/or RNA helicase
VIVEALVAELLGSYVEADELLILTPFRAQRALIRTMLKRDAGRHIRVSTVHRSQGSESKIVIFDPVDASGSFLNSASGRRLINVAASRAQAHLIVVANDKDLQNPWIKAMHSRARALWHRAGSYAEPLHVKLRAY